MNRMLKNLILTLVLITIYAVAMGSLAIFGISGMVRASGATTVSESSTASADTVTSSEPKTGSDSNSAAVSGQPDAASADTTDGDISIPLHIARLIAVGIIAVIVMVVFWVLRRVFRRYKEPTDPNLKNRSTVMMILYSILRFLTVIIAILVVLSIYNVNISGAIAGLGIAGAAGALAVQDLLKDVIMGVILVSDKYFEIGDIVEYKNLLGKVLEVTIRTTKIEGLKDKRILSVRNSNITEVAKLSHSNNILIPLPYDLPVRRAYSILEIIAERCKQHELIEEAIAKGPNAFNDSSIDYLLVIRCEPVNQLNARRAANTAILEVLEEENVQIPFPQRDIHMINS